MGDQAVVIHQVDVVCRTNQNREVASNVWIGESEHAFAWSSQGIFGDVHRAGVCGICELSAASHDLRQKEDGSSNDDDDQHACEDEDKH